jgi:hypothetical protein
VVVTPAAPGAPTALPEMATLLSVTAAPPSAAMTPPLPSGVFDPTIDLGMLRFCSTKVTVLVPEFETWKRRPSDPGAVALGMSTGCDEPSLWMMRFSCPEVWF